jgi:[citrate (pro-3S)-lyase] ligase
MVIKRVWLTKDPIGYRQWATLLKKVDLIPDDQVDWTIGIYEREQLVATGSLFKNIVKCVAVDPDYQSDNLLVKVLESLKETLADREQQHIFLYTKPELIPIFKSLGFAEIVQTNQVAFMEQGWPDFQDYLAFLTSAKTASHTNAAIVMNANPFTNGHLYLVTKAAVKHETVYVFVVSEDNSLFDTETRLRLVKAGVKRLNNVVVLPTRDYIVSNATFPAYFLKDQAQESVAQAQALLDATLFKQKIAPICDITTRYVGEEPLSKVTDIYNQAMKQVFQPDLSFIIVPRKQVEGEVISASRVRQLLQAKKYEEIQALVPETTYQEMIKQINNK